LRNNPFFFLVAFFLMLALAGHSLSCARTLGERLAKVREWFILLDYDPARTEVDNQAVSRFQMAILDPDAHPPLSGLKGKMILISYLSLGEASTYRFYWEAV